LQGVFYSDERLDAAVIRLPNGINPNLAARALTISDLDPLGDRTVERCVLMGVPSNKTKTWEGKTESERRPLVSRVLPREDYAPEFDPCVHLALQWKKQLLSEEGPHDAWSLRGCSGGGMWSLKVDA